MKIGVITYWWSNDNYGQLLQCFALQYYLREKGHDAFIIRYKPEYGPLKQFLITMKKLVLYPFKRSYYKRKKQVASLLSSNNDKREFDIFRNNYLAFSHRCYGNIRELRKNAPLADIYISGSDQVWSQLLDNENNESYFLAFGEKKTKRISYAASFSMAEYPDSLRSKLKSQLDNFDAVSTREKEGVKICESVGINATRVVDPTLLFEKSFYDKSLNLQDGTFGNYCFIYSLNISNREEYRWNELQEYCELNGLSVKVTPSSGYIPASEIFPDCIYDYCQITKWLENIKSSNLVVTSSFHGIVFSIIFHKNFVYMPLKSEMSSGNSRILELLHDLDLLSKVSDTSSPLDETIDACIDWNEVDRKLELLRMNSKKFLENYV